MKKYIICTITILCVICSTNAQNITKIEYYIDTDPGFGVATDVPVTATTPINNLNVTVPMTGLTDGFHQFFARAKDVNGEWSMVSCHQFLKVTPTSPPAATTPNITKVEYYIDTDPGFGVAIDVPISAGTPINNLNINLPMTGLTDGFHQFFARVKDANGLWSMVANHQFLKTTVVITPSATIPNIVKAEYFIDTDPGFNSGVNIPLTAGTPITNLSATINISSLALGTHRVFIRTKDALGMWSIVNTQTITIANNAVLVGTVPTGFCRTTAFNIPFVAGGTFNSGNVFTAQLSDVNGSFSSPTIIGTLTGTSSGTISATIPNITTVGTNYKIRVISSNPALTNVDEESFAVLLLCQCLNNISLMTGNWSTAGIWSCGHVPVATEPVQISTGHTITLDVNGTAKSLDLRGILNKQATKVLTIQGN